MSSKNVVEIIRRKSDGALFEVLYMTRKRAYVEGCKFIRIGPLGEPRSKRKWQPLSELETLFESVQPATAIAAVYSEKKQA